MLGFIFWKHAAGEKRPESPRALEAFDRRHARRKLRCGLVFAGAALAVLAIMAGMPVVGLIIYLVSLLPFVLTPA